LLPSHDEVIIEKRQEGLKVSKITIDGVDFPVNIVLSANKTIVRFIKGTIDAESLISVTCRFVEDRTNFLKDLLYRNIYPSEKIPDLFKDLELLLIKNLDSSLIKNLDLSLMKDKLQHRDERTVYQLVEKELYLLSFQLLLMEKYHCKVEYDKMVVKNSLRYLSTYKEKQDANDKYGRELYRKLKLLTSKGLLKKFIVNTSSNQTHLSPAGTSFDMSLIWLEGKNFKYGYISPPDIPLAVENLSGGFSQVVINNLNKNSTVYYQVEDGPVKSFKTCSDDSYHLVALGDVGLKYPAVEVFKKLQNYEASGLIICGDLSYADGSEREWDEWFQMISPVAEKIPLITAIGNHEGYDTNIYLNRVYPHKLYFSTEYPLLTIISLSSEEDYYSSNSRQYLWLEETLSKIDRAMKPWVIVTFHKPWYCSNETHHNSAEDMREGFEPLFIRRKVNLVISGHVHCYERTSKMKNFSVSEDGPVYLTVGTGGANLDEDWDSRPNWSMKRFTEYGFVDLSIEKDAINGKFIGVDGVVYDTFTVS
jgi:hypothetical protein